MALIGLRGAGKSTLGAQLAAQRGVPFIELDREIEREAGTSMNEILLLHGQAGYRRYERRALFRIAEDHPDGVVMTTGGSIVSERETFDLLQSRFYCVWLKASPEEHMSRVVAQGDMRPFDTTPAAAHGRGDGRHPPHPGQPRSPLCPRRCGGRHRRAQRQAIPERSGAGRSRAASETLETR